MPSRSPIAADAKLSLTTSAISTTIPGEAVILDPDSGRYFGLAGVGARAWSLLQGTTTLATMVRTIVAEYDVDETTCEPDLRTLLDDLQDRGLIVVDDAGA